MAFTKGLKSAAFAAAATPVLSIALLMDPGAGVASAEGSCVTENNGIEHCESFSFERRAGLGRIIWEKDVDVRYPDGHMIFGNARYWGPIPEDAMNFLPRWNGHGIDKAVDAPWCVDHN